MSHDAKSREGSLTESRVAEGTELGPFSKGIQKGSERDTEAGRKEPFRSPVLCVCYCVCVYVFVSSEHVHLLTKAVGRSAAV